MTTVPEQNCPECHGPLKGMDGESIAKFEQHLARLGVKDVPVGLPTPGLVTLCPHCAAYLTFKDDMITRPAELDDLLKLDPSTASLLETMHSFIKMFRAGPHDNVPRQQP